MAEDLDLELINAGGRIGKNLFFLKELLEGGIVSEFPFSWP
jgi:hypothetical protein